VTHSPYNPYGVRLPSPYDRPMPSPYDLREVETIRYNRALGEVQTLLGDVVRQAVQIRVNLEDELVLAAVVEELERRGYDVTPPGELSKRWKDSGYTEEGAP